MIECSTLRQGAKTDRLLQENKKKSSFQKTSNTFPTKEIRMSYIIFYSVFFF